MATGITIDDYVHRSRTSLLFAESQFDAVIDRWCDSDPLLHELQRFDSFKGKTSWDKLDPMHFKMLISTTLTAIDLRCAPHDRLNEDITLVQSLFFLLAGLIYCVQCRTESAVDTLRMIRISDNEVSFELTISLISDKRSMSQNNPQKNVLAVVVDNTKK